MSQTSGLVAGGDTITIYGTNFNANTKLYFGSVQATISHISGTKIIATVPASSVSGRVAVYVVNPDGQRGYYNNGYVYKTASSSVSISPNKGPMKGGTAVTITGSNLTQNISVYASQVEASTNNSYAIVDGNVYSWGDNTYGQLGNGTLVTSTSPVPVKTYGTPMQSKAITKVSAGSNFVLALASDGTVYSWGINANGQLGNNSTINSSLPVQITALSGVTDIAAGDNHALAVINGKVYAWGYNNNGQLGDGTTTTALAPELITGILSGQVTKVSAGGAFSMALDTNNNTIYTWGLGTSGQLGNGTVTSSSTPVLTTMTGVLSGKTITAISAGSNHALVLSSDGNVYSWGDNTYGELGNNTTANSSVPVLASTNYLAGIQATAISAGSGFSLAVDVNGNVYSWGYNNVGQLGDNTTTSHSSPKLIYTGSTLNSVPISLISAGSNHALVAAYGQVYSFGNNGGGKLGDGTTTNRSAAVTINNATIVPDVTFGGSLATVTSANINSLVVNTPAHSPSIVDVSISGSYISTVTLSKAFTYYPDKYIFLTTPVSGGLPATKPTAMTIAAADQYGNIVVPDYDIDIALSSTSAGGFFAHSLTENPTTEWSYSDVTMPAGSGSVTFYYKDSYMGTPTITATGFYNLSVSQQQTINSRYMFSVTGVSNPIQAGVPSSVTVRVVDWQGEPLTDYIGTIHFTSTDTAALLPTNYTMKTSDMGVKTFVNGVTMNTSGSGFCVTATDTHTTSITGQQCGITVTPPNTGIPYQLKITTPKQNFPSNGYSSPITVQVQDVNGDPVSVSSALTLHVYTNSTTGSFATDPTSTWTAGGSSGSGFNITVPKNLTSTSFYYKDTSVRTSTISVRDLTTDTGDGSPAVGDYGLINAAQDIDSGAGAPTTMSITGPTRLDIGQQGTYTIHLQDDNGNPVTATSDILIRVDSDTTTGQFYDTTTGATLVRPIYVVIPAGSQTVNFIYADTNVTTATIRAVDARDSTQVIRLHDATFTVRTGVGDPVVAKIEGISTAYINTPRQLQATLYDKYGNVTFSLTGSITVNLTDNSGGHGTFNPTSVTIPMGASSADFTYTSNKLGSYILTSSSASLPDTNDFNINVVVGPYHFLTPGGLQFTSAPLSLLAGQIEPITLGFFDDSGLPTVTDHETSIHLTTDNGTITSDQTGTTPITDIDVPTGSSSVTFYYFNTTPGSYKVYAQDNEKTTTQPIKQGPQINQTETVSAGVFDHLIIQPVAANSRLNSTTSLTASMVDVYGNITTSSTDQTAYLKTSSATGLLASSASSAFSNTLNMVIPAGSSSASFVFKDSVLESSPVIVAGKSSAWTTSPTTSDQGISQITITSALATTLKIVGTTVNSFETTAGMPTDEIDVELLDSNGNPAIQDGTTNVQISTDNGLIMLSPADAITKTNANSYSINYASVPRGDYVARFYYGGTVKGIHSLTAAMPNQRDNKGLVSAPTVGHGNVTVDAADPSSLAYTDNSKSKVDIHVPSGPVTVSLTDDYGNLTSANSNTTINFTSNCSDATISANLSPWQAITSSTIAQGSYSTTVYFKAESINSCNLVAAAGNFNSATRTFNVVSGEPVTMKILGGDQTKIKGQSTTVTAQLYDADGNVTPARNNYTLKLTSTSGTATYDHYVELYSGSPTATFNYLDKVSGVSTITVSDVTSASSYTPLPSDSIQITYLEGSPQSISFTPSHISLKAGQIAKTNAQLLNEYGVPLNATSNVTAALSTSNISGSFYSDSAMTTPISSFTINSGDLLSGDIYYSQTVATSSVIYGTDVTGNLTSATANVATVPAGVDSMVYSSAAYTGTNALQLGQTGNITVQLHDQYGNVTSTPTDFTLYVSSSSSTAVYPGIITIPAGSSSVTFNYADDTLGAATITVSDNSTPTTPDTGLTDITQDVEVVYGPATQITASPSSFSLERGGVSPRIDIITRNRYGREVPVQVDVTVSPSYYVYEYGDSSNPGLFSATANGTFTSSLSLTIPAGSSRTSFYYRNDTARIRDYSCYPTTSGNASCYIWGYSYGLRIVANVFSDDGNSRRNAYTDVGVNMYFGNVTQYIFTTPEYTQYARHTSDPITIKQLNQYGIEVPASGNEHIFVRSSASGTGEFGGTTFRSSVINWGANYVTMYPGDSTVSFYYRDSAVGDPIMTASDLLPITPDTGITNAVQPIHIIKQIVDNFLVTNISSPQAQGTPSSVVVNARDKEGYIVDWYNGTVTFSSDDSTAILPSTYTFDPAVDKGSHTFTNSVAFRKTGTKTVTATDTNGITGSQTDIEVGIGNTAPVAKVVFSQPASPYVLTQNAVSIPITVSLKDASGADTNADMNGFKVRLTTSSPTGQIAFSPGGPWQSELVTTIPEGLSYANVYYRDSQMGDATLTVTDWQDDTDNPAISNDNLSIIVGDVEITPTGQLTSLDAFGNMVPAAYMFSHDETGNITATSLNDFVSSDPMTGDKIDVLWRTEWREGVTPLELNEDDSGKNTIDINHSNMTAQAGDKDYFAVAQATRSTFLKPEEVVSKQIASPVSPFISNLQLDSTKVIVNKTLTGSLTITNKREAVLPSSVKLLMLKSTATDITDPIKSINLTPAYLSKLSIDLNSIPTGTYKLLAVTYDGSGNITSEDMSDNFDIVNETPVTPTNPTTPTTPTNPSNPTNNTTTTNTTNPTTPTTPTKPTKPGKNNSSTTTTKTTMGGFLGLLKSILANKATPYVVPGIMLGAIVFMAILLIYQAYKEVKQARFLLAIIKKDRQTVEDKESFLSLASHYLRTPVTLISSAVDMLTTMGKGTNAALIASLMDVSSSLKTKIENILTNTKESKNLSNVEAEDIKVARLKTFTSPIFWLPVILSIVLTILVNWAITKYGHQTLNGTLIINQVLMIVVGFVLLYTGVRLLTMRRARKEALERSRLKILALDQAKMDFINLTYHSLTNDILHMSGLNLAGITNEFLKNTLKEGTIRLSNLVSRFATLSSLAETAPRKDLIKLGQLIDQTMYDLSKELDTNTIKVNNLALLW